MPEYKFEITGHVAERIVERGLDLEDLKAVINYPDRQFRRENPRGEHGGFVYKFFKTVKGKTLVAVAEIKSNTCWIITGYYHADI